MLSTLISMSFYLRCPVTMTRKNDQRNSCQINRTGISVILRICPNKLRSSKNKHTCKQSVLTHTEARGVCDSMYTMVVWQSGRRSLATERRLTRTGRLVCVWRQRGCVRGVGVVHTELSRRSLGRETRASVGRCSGPTTAYYRCPLDKTTQLQYCLEDLPALCCNPEQYYQWV